ncbi:MAG: hypothetical protein K5921_00570 [Lachnospiraceae bacterium]|nr:hypothetical protein [Lachnospiraceae bacterium]
MVWFIIILIVVCALASPSDNSQQHYQAPKKMSRRERKRIQKARDRAEMDAWEDMMMYYEVFCDD